MGTSPHTGDVPTPLRAARARLARALRSRVAGDDAATRARLIWGSEGERWFTPDDVVWAVHADASMFVGGIRALLLQSLHPLAMAGVAGHSGYKGDPWGRLQRTSGYIATTTFGTIEHADATIEHVRSIHERVRGKAHDGRPYRASDPHLLHWVHIAEAESFLLAYEAYGERGRRRLSEADRDTYLSQAAVSARRLGVLDPPLTYARLRADLQAFRPELESTSAAREAARFLLLHPPLPPASLPGYAMLAGGALAILPVWARRELGLPVLPGADAVLGRPVGRTAAGLVRWAMADPSVATDRVSRPQT